MLILACCLLATPALAEEPWVQEQEQEIAQLQPTQADVDDMARELADLPDLLWRYDGPIVPLNLSAEDRRVIGFAVVKRKLKQQAILSQQGRAQNRPLDPHQVRVAYDVLTGRPITLMEAVPLNAMLLTARNMKAVTLAREVLMPAIRKTAQSMESAGY